MVTGFWYYIYREKENSVAPGKYATSRSGVLVTWRMLRPS